VARLGEILVELAACNEGQIQQGLENQVIFGGRLGTNLLDLGSLTEEALAHGLQRRYGRPCLHGNLRLDPAALPLLKPEMVDRLEVLPYIVQDRKLAILVCDPGDLAALDEVAFATGRRIHPIVVPQARMWALMRKHYRLDRQLRGIEPSGRPRLAGPSSPPIPEREAGPDLMDQAEFEALYARRVEPPTLGAPAEEIVDLVEEVVAGTVAEHDAREAVLAAMRHESAGHAPPPVFTPQPGAFPVAPAPEPSPLGFSEAARFLDGVADRSAIAHTVLRHARSHFERAVLLTVHRGALSGWEGLGPELDRGSIRRLRLPLGVPGVFDTVVRSRAHFLGPLQKTEANLRFLRALGGGVPRNAFVVPILALERVVNVLYADNGRGGVVETAAVGELLILATKIAGSYDALLRRTLRPA
jgi:hypothetical protein